jgi:hypothetical protein
MRGQSLRTALATSLLLAIAAPSWSCGTMEPPSASPPPDNSGSTNNSGGGGGQNPGGGGAWNNGGGGGGGGGSWNNGGGEGMREGADNAANVDMGDGGGGGGRRSQPPGGGSQNFSSQISALGASNAGTGGGGAAPVWCLMQRQAANGNQEQTVIKCDDMAGAGPSWRPIASNMTFTSASAMRDSFNAGNPAMVWCVMQRLRADGFTYEQTVIRCDDMAGAGPGWFPTGNPNLDFTTASSMRDAFNAANPPR